MNEEEGATPSLASVECGANRRLHINWGLGNELHLFDIAKQDGGEARARSALDGPETSSSKLTVVKWGWQSGSERRICYDCLQPWVEIQKQRTSGQANDPNWWRTVLEYSKRVSQVLGRQDDVRVPRGIPANEEEAWIAIRRIVWELLEIFYVNQAPSLSAQIQDFLAWLQRNSQVLIGMDANDSAAPLEAMLSGLYDSPAPELEPRYWKCVQILVFLGFNEAALDLLGIHSAWTRWQNQDTAVRAQFEILESLITILQKMPRLAGSAAAGGASSGAPSLGTKVFTNVSDYNLYKSKWSQACREVLENDFLWDECKKTSEVTAIGGKSLLRGLLGQEQTLRECTRGWAELLCAQLLHRYRTISELSELSSLVEYCVGKEAGGGGHKAVVVEIMEAIFLDNVQEVLSLSSQTLGPWFMAHIPELILAKGDHARSVREIMKPIKGRTQAEFFVLDFVESMIANPLSWRTACEYLAWCPTCGEEGLKAFLLGLPLHAQEDAIVLNALQLATRHGLPAVGAQICRTVGIHAFSLGQVARAKFWLKEIGGLSLDLIKETSREDPKIKDLLEGETWESYEELLETLCADKVTGEVTQIRLALAHKIASAIASEGMPGRGRAEANRMQQKRQINKS